MYVMLPNIFQFQLPYEFLSVIYHPHLWGFSLQYSYMILFFYKFA